ncbi:hypothetical protein HJC23_005798 [Cyclotella cryptica]|uniref:Uncharacterized protein n=1 Tax=Cyclotella cryptica TaxID=29204 RepID=A0ABD3QYP3_9STRA|eukprot:CCRYP_000294-RA/>CCRYP_000294-RA protein AED:0.43 eAED:0.43 QI:0/-1/0/1/-1/1/1/0/395
MMQTLLIAALAIASTSTSDAFAPSPISPRTYLPTSPTVLYGSNRRGKLGNNIALNDDGKISKIMTKKEKQKLGNSKSMRRGKKDQVVQISPLLAEWAKSDSDTPSDGTRSSVSSVDAATVFTSFDDDDDIELAGSRGKKRKTTNTAPSIASANSAKVNELLENIEQILSTPNCDIPKLLSCITSLVHTSDDTTQLLLPNLKSILSKRPSSKDEKQPSYRLAWAGSDASICHIGTSLHKVPLARLQEIYLCLGYNRWELLEVIRILGPFPNVRNTLRGEVKVQKLKKGTGFASGGNGVGGSLDSAGREAIRMTIAYNSMIDGTGKEILAGKQDNVKYVMLDVWFANEKAIVCTIVPTEEVEGEVMSDPLTSGNGEKVLLFVAEENLEEELEKLRAA